MPRYSLLIIALLIAAFSSCSSLKLNGPEAQAPPPALPKAALSINLGLEIPLSYVQGKINESLTEKLFKEEGLELGNGLYADVDLKKNGRFSLSATEEGKVLVGLPVFLDGKVRLEKKIFGQKISSAIPFQENLSPQVSFIPQINSDYSFGIEELDILSWGKALQYDFLGFNIDFEPLVKKKMIGVMEDQLASGSLKSLDIKQIANNFWATFGQPRYLDNGLSASYLYTRPDKIAVENQFTNDQKLLLNIGLEGEVLRQKEKPLPTQLAALPPVSQENVQGNDFNLTLPIYISFDEMAAYLEKQLKGKLITVDKQTKLLPKKFSLRHFGERTLITMEFTGKRSGKKDLDGTFYLAGKPVFDPQSQNVVLEAIDFKLSTKNFLANTTNWLKRRKILKAIRKKAVFPVEEQLAKAKTILLQESQLDLSLFALSLQSPEIVIEGIYPSETGLDIYVKAAAAIDARWNP
ncbi:DUF4403 family protein [Cyclobacterium sp. 1_MG-2023]|uniref:DUF4403 family protein n=1 Tax=Cyclobacterium sp. 1_MG-2023 TaxID=3062681 RepID=UPI0026E2F5F8|nr:DUF4403 family protein [Cyclobacterium sp. 1_MG-2023]MDO6437870.1 DUF4403 family protein [Cyclobacterium sp. 1_MG-2023]